MASTFFRVTHEYDIGDRSAYFSFDESSIDETAKELAVYLQFKVEHEVDDSIAVDNVTVVRFLELFGAKQLETKPNADFVTIDMYWDRERSCSDWYLENYKLLDAKYSDKTKDIVRAEKEAFSQYLNDNAHDVDLSEGE
ncbi:hypothetical protein NMR52_003635 [Vibrio cholerae]|nr:hypothetical protein [Vibrio cholerae]EKF9843090.1 hypothetical protein [Vibrio cholerae]